MTRSRTEGKILQGSYKTCHVVWVGVLGDKEANENKMEVAKMRMLRLTCGKTMFDRIPNKVFLVMLGVASITDKLRERRL